MVNALPNNLSTWTAGVEAATRRYSLHARDMLIIFHVKVSVHVSAG